ncbi:hypothetical protein [Burkholderia gladioli]|uniref:hypothetical protein n=1 Tax=Burkholderia gladioli TaxID=28095 RepID=UPI00163FDA17|nr:hypothetical protein [Burkholderia gladioli]
MNLTARDVGKPFAIKLGRPMIYQGFERDHHLFIYRDPPRDHAAYRPDQLWMIERLRPAAAPVLPEA